MQRNGQNPVKSAKNFGPKGGAPRNAASAQVRSTKVVGHCPSCRTEVPPKPGFRFSALKCPNCGAPMGRK
ncbi:MAG TPA: hypothetical protein DCZ01_02940 [Elusimicrobia bacterium]|nr:MAG: hypothetical protein A2X37_05575 [Elusimicrobia bacterium GWA2_66_18]HAZ07487.1 hypothetical protein [Elusimicrobiota bacterium]